MNDDNGQQQQNDDERDEFESNYNHDGSPAEGKAPDKSVNDVLSSIQLSLHAPKDQNNKFGNYSYRKAEDILQAVKPLLDGGLVLLDDDIVLIGDRYYVKATATLVWHRQMVTATAFAREDLIKKGMDVAQVTGAASSYARKYALNGLFAIDDTKDADSMDNRQPQKKAPTKPVKLSKEQADTIDRLIVETSSDKEGLLHHYSVKSLYEIDQILFGKIKSQLESKK